MAARYAGYFFGLNIAGGLAHEGSPFRRPVFPVPSCGGTSVPRLGTLFRPCRTSWHARFLRASGRASSAVRLSSSASPPLSRSVHRAQRVLACIARSNFSSQDVRRYESLREILGYALVVLIVKQNVGRPVTARAEVLDSKRSPMTALVLVRLEVNNFCEANLHVLHHRVRPFFGASSVPANHCSTSRRSKRT